MRKRPLTQYAEQLRNEYLAAAGDEQWRECLRIAERLQTLHLDNHDTAEAIFAAGYAHERLGDAHQARRSITRWR